MSESKKALAARANKLRRQIAEAEATLDGYRLDLAKTEAKLTGQPVPVSGLEKLWEIALPICRNRSSQHLCRVAWNRIPKAERPTMDVLVNALKVWNRCTEWKKDGNAYVPGLDKWITQRRWQDLPEVEAAPSRYRNNPKPVRQADPAEAVTDPAMIASLLSLKLPQPPRMPS